jgi:hypothetical protein
MLRVWVLLAAFLAPIASLHAQKGEPLTGGEEKGPFLGVLFASVSEALYDQLPQLPRKQGVLVTHILPDSPERHFAAIRRPKDPRLRRLCQPHSPQ